MSGAFHIISDTLVWRMSRP